MHVPLLTTEASSEALVVQGLSGVLPQGIPTGDFPAGEQGRAKVSSFVAQALATAGWADVDVSKIQCENISGGGGSSTYKVWCDGAHPPCVILHSRNPNVVAQQFSEARAQAAQKLFASHNLAPTRLAEGSDWYIECYGGEALGEPCKLKDGTPEELGALLARVHALPTDWFEEWRTRLKADFPVLSEAPDESVVWKLASRFQTFFEGFTEDHIKFYISSASELHSEMRSQHSKRLVTIHADFHPGNMVRGSDGTVKLIDLEFSHVGSAVGDIWWVFFVYLNTARQQRSFAEAYLNASGYSATPDKVDELLFDVQIRTLVYPLYTGIKESLDSSSGLDEFNKLRAIIKKAGDDAALRKKVIERGILNMDTWANFKHNALKCICGSVVLVPLVLAPVAGIVAVVYAATH